MRVVFDGRFPVHYGQAYILSSPTDVNSELDAAFAGQVNGLLGAAVPGQLWLTTGLHTGHVRLRITMADAEPVIDDACQEVVEVSFTPTSSSGALTGWGGEAPPVRFAFDVTPYRVRLCASNMDAARAKDTILEGEDVVDQYEVAFWIAPQSPDRVLKQTSAIAAYWHDWARALPRR